MSLYRHGALLSAAACAAVSIPQRTADTAAPVSYSSHHIGSLPGRCARPPSVQGKDRNTGQRGPSATLLINTSYNTALPLLTDVLDLWTAQRWPLHSVCICSPHASIDTSTSASTLIVSLYHQSKTSYDTFVKCLYLWLVDFNWKTDCVFLG